MNNLTLIIPAKKEAESLPVFLKELEQYNCEKIIVLQKDDIETIDSVKSFQKIHILKQKKMDMAMLLLKVSTMFKAIIVVL